MAGFNSDNLGDSEILQTRDYLNVADEIGLEGVRSSADLHEVRQSIKDAENSTERPPNLVVFI